MCALEVLFFILIFFLICNIGEKGDERERDRDGARFVFCSLRFVRILYRVQIDVSLYFVHDTKPFCTHRYIRHTCVRVLNFSPSLLLLLFFFFFIYFFY